jgi:hypothetical protein
MMGLVRQGKRKVRGTCFVVTWDVDSRDRSAVNRVQYFLFDRTFRRNGKEYVHPGFVWKEGVQYVAQSALFVSPERLDEIRRILEANGIDYEVQSILVP